MQELQSFSVTTVSLNSSPVCAQYNSPPEHPVKDTWRPAPERFHSTCLKCACGRSQGGLPANAPGDDKREWPGGTASSQGGPGEGSGRRGRAGCCRELGAPSLREQQRGTQDEHTCLCTHNQHNTELSENKDRVEETPCEMYASPPFSVDRGVYNVMGKAASYQEGPCDQTVGLILSRNPAGQEGVAPNIQGVRS